MKKKEMCLLFVHFSSAIHASKILLTKIKLFVVVVALARGFFALCSSLSLAALTK